jgi:Na+/melibiose symporter-like transporter
MLKPDPGFPELIRRLIRPNDWRFWLAMLLNVISAWLLHWLYSGQLTEGAQWLFTAIALANAFLGSFFMLQLLRSPIDRPDQQNPGRKNQTPRRGPDLR